MSLNETHTHGRFIQIVQWLLPMPFTIAVVLTFVTFLLAGLLTHPPEGVKYPLALFDYWQEGIWNNGLMVFAMQMMLILVLGHVLALTPLAGQLIGFFTRHCTDTARSAAIVSAMTILVSLFNWGLGLIFGAVFARKVAEHAVTRNIPINYPLIGAAGYSGLMVWHGGLSGSAPLKVAESGHFFADKMGVIPMTETVFSSMNVIVSLMLLVFIPLLLFILGKRATPAPVKLNRTVLKTELKTRIHGAEWLDHSRMLAYVFSGIILWLAIRSAVQTFSAGQNPLSFINPNYINFLLFGLGILLHGSFHRFVNAVDEAIGGAAGILIQFPLYFGIMGIMNQSGLVEVFASFFVKISSDFTYPLFTFISAAIVNIFVPSGGGQWVVQGGIIIDAARELGVSLPKCVMAMAYGDELTNMLQPFWALPLLGITGLHAREIIPYTLIIMLAGTVIFTTGLILF